MPDGPERLAVYAELKRLAVVYMPYKAHTHRLATDLMQRRVIGFRRPLFWQDWWQYVDLLPGAQAAA